MTTAEQELIDRVTQAIRDSNGTPEALEWWRKHPQIVPAHVYARAAIDAMREAAGQPYTDAELARDPVSVTQAVTAARAVPPVDTLYGYALGQPYPPDQAQIHHARALLDGRGPDPIPVKALDIAQEIVHRAEHAHRSTTPC